MDTETDLQTCVEQLSSCEVVIVAPARLFIRPFVIRRRNIHNKTVFLKLKGINMWGGLSTKHESTLMIATKSQAITHFRNC